MNPPPFEAIGRQSLLLALIFVGGITLSPIFTFQIQSLAAPEFWLSYFVILLLTALIFFLSMLPTHRILAAEKKRELERIQQYIIAACRELVDRLDQVKEPGVLPAEINALVVYEQRLMAARTWPYNTPMLRTLFFSILVPLGTGAARLIGEMVFN